MNDKGSGARTRFSAWKAPAAEGRAQGLDIGWTVFGYLIAGMLAYGAIGWLIGRTVHVSLLFPIGMLVGLAISIGFIIYRYGKQGAATGVWRDGQSPQGGGQGGLGGRAVPRERGDPGGSSLRGGREMTGEQ